MTPARSLRQSPALFVILTMYPVGMENMGALDTRELFLLEILGG